MNAALKFSEHLRKYLLLYVFLVIFLALLVGYYNVGFFKAHKVEVKNAIILLAIATLYPSMIQLRSEKFRSELKGKIRETVLALLFIFLIAPLLAMGLAGFLPNKELAIGYVAANTVPASSASIAYVLLAEGNIEFATLLAILSIVGALVAVPVCVGFYARSIAVNLPIAVLGESIALALLTPFILGQLTRHYAVKGKARRILKSPNVNMQCKRIVLELDSLNGIVRVENIVKHVEDALECIETKISKRMKPYLSMATMLSMLTLIFLLIANKAFLLIEKPILACEIIGLQLVVYGVLIASIIAVSKLLKLSYRDHMGMVFIAITKNQSVAAAISVMAIGAAAAIPAALIPAIQPIVAIVYIAIAPMLRKLLTYR